MISGALCRGMADQSAGGAAAGGVNLNSTASGATVAPVDLTQPDPLDALIAKILQLVTKVDAEITASPSVAAPAVPAATAVPCKAADKVELIMMEDSSNNLFAAAKKNVKFTIVDLSRNSIGDIDSPLKSFDEYLDITQVATTDTNIRDSIINRYAALSVKIKHFEDIKLKLPDTDYGKKIKDALALIVKFHNDILTKTTPDALIHAKKEALRWYSHFPKVNVVASKVARKSLELLYAAELALAIKAHDMLISAAEDYFNMHIVYHNPSGLFSDTLRAKADEQDKACTDICANIVGSLTSFETIRDKIIGKYPSDYINTGIKTPLSALQVTVNGITTDIADTVTNSNLLLITQQIAAISSTFSTFISVRPAPSLALINDISTELVNIVTTITPSLNTFKSKIDTVIGFLNEKKTEYNDLDKQLTLFKTAAPLSLQVKINVEYEKVKHIMDDISSGIATIYGGYAQIQTDTDAAMTDLTTLKTSIESHLGRRVGQSVAEMQAVATQKTLDISNNPEFGEWDTIYTTIKPQIDASFNAVMQAATQNAARNPVIEAYIDVSNNYKIAETSLGTYNNSENRGDLMTNLADFTTKVRQLRGNITRFNTAYQTYITSLAFTTTLAAGKLTLKKNYVEPFLRAVFQDIATTDPSYNVVTTVYNTTDNVISFTMNRINADLTRDDISNNTLRDYAGVALMDIAGRANVIVTAGGGAAAGPGLPTPAQAEADRDKINAYIRDKLPTFIATYMGASSPPVMVGGSRYRVTRRRHTGSKRLRKTRARK